MDYTIKKLTAADFDEYTDFVDFVFSTANKPNDCKRTLPKLYQPDDEHMSCNYAAISGGKIRAAVGSYPQTINIAGASLKVAGIGAVTTHRDFTGHGLMRALMESALGDMAANGVQISHLGGLRQRYGYYGYEKCGRTYRMEISELNTARSKAPAADCELKILEPGDDSYLRFIDSLYCQQPWHAERQFDSLYKILTSWQSVAYIALHNGQPVGYLIARGGLDRERVTELFVADDKPEYYNGIIRSFARLSGGLRLFVPAWKPAYLREASRYAEEIAVEHQANWHVFDFAGLAQALFALKSTWSPPFPGNAVIGIEGYGSLSIEVPATGPVICRKTADSPDFTTDHLTATRFLFGNLPPEAVYQGAKSTLFASWFPLPLCGLSPDAV